MEVKSISGQLNKEEFKKWARNLVIFTAPIMAIFFGQLASGVEFKKAMWVGIIALYGALSDLFKKIEEGQKQ